MTAVFERDPRVTFLQAIGDITEQLHRRFGVTVDWADIGELATWDGHHRTVTLAADATLEDQAWALAQAWTLCVVGRSAVPDAVARRHLSAVN